MENKFIRVDEVADELGVSRPYAYKLIRQLNEELKGKGFITIAGRVNRQYFNERLYGARAVAVESGCCHVNNITRVGSDVKWVEEQFHGN